MTKGTTAPIEVTFAVANFNSIDFIEACLSSALLQKDVSVEVIVVDDGSSDASDELVEAIARRDQRVRFFRTPSNLGPGGARNLALQHMRGDWFAVLDSDDIVEPWRSRRLIEAAREAKADMVADDLVIFGEGMPDGRFLNDSEIGGDLLSLDRYFANSVMYGGKPNPGFLKPMIARTLIERTGIRYDESLRIAEDDDLVIRLLMSGARYLVTDVAGYRYRKHGASISHRLSRQNAAAMASRADALGKELKNTEHYSVAFRKRQRGLFRAVAFAHAIDALQKRRFLLALRHVVRNPGAIRLFSLPLKARLDRLIRAVSTSSGNRRSVPN